MCSRSFSCTHYLHAQCQRRTMNPSESNRASTHNGRPYCGMINFTTWCTHTVSFMRFERKPCGERNNCELVAGGRIQRGTAMSRLQIGLWGGAARGRWVNTHITVYGNGLAPELLLYTDHPHISFNLTDTHEGRLDFLRAVRRVPSYQGGARAQCVKYYFGKCRRNSQKLGQTFLNGYAGRLCSPVALEIQLWQVQVAITEAY